MTNSGRQIDQITNPGRQFDQDILPCFHFGSMVLYQQLPQLWQQDALLTGHPLLKLCGQGGVLPNDTSPEEPDPLHCLSI